MGQADSLLPLIKDVAKAEQAQTLACQSCALYRLCLPLGLHREDLVALDQIIRRRDSFRRGQRLFESGCDLTSLYVVRSGAFKTTVSAKDGREQVTGFYFPGEFIGLDALHLNTYPSTARALELSSVCALPFDKLQMVSKSIPALQHQLLTRLSRALSDDKDLLLSLGQKSAEEKLVTFLIALSTRFSERGFSAYNFQLPMSRGDIANHLGLALETVSRIFTRLQQADLIAVQGKSLTLLQPEALQTKAG
ncbi:Fumarate and nitrate reduction regulatory protein [Methylophaga frappieri]|uniref:Fumarate and nitrate reduction regulatory protein n=1 Tax=Methylophaga frappieri (strain ATCC BAA-2434 / DSM 25690 / JAM7) TaxID=754477 RepID=I1YJN4_METFJ|nr:fumarate/nitrate reduction transcriptional regulator Fnr [Methylophaga frappieri]AFJ03127.1 Fumarate and nitrate reduction regulatory protein [Methylophaga frappieri]